MESQPGSVSMLGCREGVTSEWLLFTRWIEGLKMPDFSSVGSKLRVVSHILQLGSIHDSNWRVYAKPPANNGEAGVGSGEGTGWTDYADLRCEPMIFRHHKFLSMAFCVAVMKIVRQGTWWGELREEGFRLAHRFGGMSVCYGKRQCGQRHWEAALPWQKHVAESPHKAPEQGAGHRPGAEAATAFRGLSLVTCSTIPSRSKDSIVSKTALSSSQGPSIQNSSVGPQFRLQV